ncbi:MAG: CCA tRNA nucleotidyltransferase [Candidatus Margulisiibacteriota bacterium]
MFTLPKGVLNIISKLQQNGFQAYVVGGAVRDLLLGNLVYDWDITSDALPKQVSSLFEKVVPTGIKYGTVTVMLDDGDYEVTTFRCDEKYSDGRHPDKVSFTKDLKEDLSRRDFTVNAIAYDPVSQKIIDPYGGRDDLEKKIIRAVGDPLLRFKEDGLRCLRACRFAAKLNFEIDKKTLAAVPVTLKVFKKVASERVRDEILKIISSEKPSIGFEYMRQTGLLKIVLPELEKCVGIKQPKEFHAHDVYFHAVYACDAAPKELPVVRLAALLHDISKPQCKYGDTFYDHDNKGAVVAEKIMKRLKFGSDDIKEVKNLIKNHMFNYTGQWSDSAVRRFIKRVGLGSLEDLFMLRIADMKAMEREIDAEYLKELKDRIKRVVDDENALNISDLKINGKDIMKELKISQGPKIGRILSFLLDNVLEDPSLNSRNILLSLAKKYNGAK